MNATQHQNIVGFIWNIANKLRGPYRPPQYRRVMLPLVVLRRLDLVLEPTKDKVLAEHKRLIAKGIKDAALDKALSRVATGGEREQPLYNISPFTFQKLLGDPPHIANNLIAYIHGFSPRARDIFDKFDFEAEILKLDEANRLYLILQEFCSPDVDLSPQRVKNLQMGYLFEELVRKFNEQANEEAGDHFTPREVIRLMVNILFSGEQDIYTKGISKSIYDPTAGTGGMLSVSEEFIRRQNPDANLQLYGQEYNPESYALCCSDLLIKDEPIDKLVFGDTLGVKEAKNKGSGFVPGDGHPDKRFHYMLANPPFGVEWKPEEDYVRDEFAKTGFNGRFGAGLPRINDGSLLFLQHMISKRHPAPEEGGDGSKIAIVFNGSPLFTGDAGSGESNKPEPDAELRDTEIVPLPKNIPLPLPLGYDNVTGHDDLLKLVKKPCEDYLKTEVLPHVPDAWIDHKKTRVGYEIPLTRHFYVYEPPRPLEEIEAEIKALETDIVAMLSEVV